MTTYPILCPIPSKPFCSNVDNVITFVINLFDASGKTTQALETFEMVPSNPSDVETGGLDDGLNNFHYGSSVAPGPVPLYYDVSASPSESVTLGRIVLAGPAAPNFRLATGNFLVFSDLESRDRQNVWCPKIRHNKSNVGIFYIVTRANSGPPIVDELTINLLDARTNNIVQTEVDPQIKNNG